MDYVELICEFKQDELLSEILVAELSVLGFESFTETGEGINAYIPSHLFAEEPLYQLHIIKSRPAEVSFSFNTIKDKNWNEIWESNYSPVIFKGKCAVIAPFHKKIDSVDMNIIIEPKMSFGTAHHETTALMIDLIFANLPINKKVLDMGCGTGILAILASKLGAKSVEAIDNDEWAFKNALENVSKNNLNNVNVYLGDAGLLTGKLFDTIIANINKNILMRDIPDYSAALTYRGKLLLSGFYENDNRDILAVCKNQGLGLVEKASKNNWSALVVEKSD